MIFAEEEAVSAEVGSPGLQRCCSAWADSGAGSQRCCSHLTFKDVAFPPRSTLSLEKAFFWCFWSIGIITETLRWVIKMIKSLAHTNYINLCTLHIHAVTLPCNVPHYLFTSVFWACFKKWQWSFFFKKKKRHATLTSSNYINKGGEKNLFRSRDLFHFPAAFNLCGTAMTAYKKGKPGHLFGPFISSIFWYVHDREAVDFCTDT